MTFYKLTNSPGPAFAGQAALVVGVERDRPGAHVRVYLDRRSRGIYLPVAPGSAADAAERTWIASSRQHLWITPVPSDDALYADEHDRTMEGLA